MLTVRQIEGLVVSQVCEIQELSGRPLPATIDGSLEPIGGCQGFDSLNAVEVAVQISVILGCEIKGNPFAEGNNALSIRVIARELHNLQVDGANNGKR